MPKLSVIMSVYNGEKFISEAIESILDQTFTDFEFIIVDDGSTDATPKILQTFSKKDSRIKVLPQHNQGLTKSLNRGIGIANGTYIARMDADDVSLPNRLASEISILDSNPQIKCVGTNAIIINENGKSIKKIIADENKIQNLYKRNCLIHGSLVFKKEALQKIGGYDEHIRFAQDYDLLLRLADTFSLQSIKIIDECLYKLRRTAQNISTKKFFRQLYYTALAQYKSTLRHSKKEYGSIHKLFIFLKHYLYVFIVIYKFGAPKLLRIFKIIS